MKKAELMDMVGKTVRIVFFDDDVQTGKLGFTTEFSAAQGYRHVGLFTINDRDFRVSHIKNITEI